MGENDVCHHNKSQKQALNDERMNRRRE